MKAKTLFIITFLEVTCFLQQLYALETKGTSELISKSASRVRSMILRVDEFPKGKEGIIFDLSTFQIESIAKKIGYNSSIHDHFWITSAVAKQCFLDAEDGDCKKDIQIMIFAGHNCSENAQLLMYSDMANTSMMITETTFGIIPKGPGEVCLTMNLRLNLKDDDIRRIIWFYRKNVAIGIRGSGETNLLPIAMAIDEALKACPLINADKWMKELPDLKVNEPILIKENKKVKYRIQYEPLEALKESQKVVICIDHLLADAKEFDGYIEVVPIKGTELPLVVFGVYDSKKIWVKWHNESE
jgi:hypothetical protein